ncbi:TPA: hypothetical protein EYN65_07915 [Candidatus Poribacteria bacterium]|nr:hypothetical protein [Candidatus Poribacteria bacterium]HIC00608.1 hypothetical protein [Candidatus Poribacteria bacterium]HIM10502.1 hypothetical protein [Candidatus Poribacteria bacterium]HIO50186.1 hypothetical protein [Candidatus Poribacteria bacterium]
MSSESDIAILNQPQWPSIKRILLHVWLGFIVLSTLIICLCTLNYAHSWGGDFSAYIMQARSICQFSTGEFIENNRVTVEQSSTRVGPVAYPWGFPVMLVPIYATCGLHLFALKMVGVLSYLGLLVVIWYGFERFHTPLWRSACVLLFAVNPTLIGFTNHILSDILFLCISTLAICLMGRIIVEQHMLWSPMKDRILLGTVIACAFFVRTNGILLFGVLCWSQLVVMCSFIWNRHKQGTTWREAAVGLCKKDSENPHKRLLPFVPYISLGCLILFWKLILAEGGTSHFEHLEHVNIESIKENSIYYRDLLANFFSGIPDYEDHKGQWIAYIATLPFVVIGLIRHIRIGHHMLIYVLLTYVLFILWPHKQGLRFLFPVLPFYMLFFISGLSLFARGSWVWIEISTTFVCVLPVLFMLFHFGSHSIHQAEMQLQTKDMVKHGPFSDDSLEMFDFIQEQTTTEDMIVFFKPRVMRLMTNRNTLRIDNINDLFVADYVCFFNNLHPFSIDHMQALERQQRAEIKFSNKNYVVYKLHHTVSVAD